MNLSIWLLTATWVAGGPGDGATYIGAGTPAPQSQVIYYAPSAEEKHGPFAGLRARLQNLRSGQAQEGTMMMPAAVVL